MLPVDPALYALFLGTMTIFAITPGPANLFSIATGVRAGPRAALLGVAGMNAATLVWIAAAALGLGALVNAYPAAFRVVAILGALYVAWLGVKSLWSAWKGTAQLKTARGSAAETAFRDGFAVQFANPKVIVFFTAVLPPFVDPARPIVPQLMLLGAAVIVCDVIAMAGYGLAGGALAKTLTEPRAQRGFAAIVGVLLLIAAAMIALRD
jgi:threonine/homoserine/homoserine lactone efflux protein